MELNPNIEQAYLETYDAQADAIFRYCYARVRDREKARDLMQESFLRTWTYLANGHKVDNLRAFTYRVANNLIIDDSRKKHEASLDAMQEQTGFDPPGKSGGAGAEETRIMGEDAKIALNQLPDIYQEVLKLRYLEEFTPKEIAGILHTSQTVVSVRIWRGLRKLKSIFTTKYDPGTN